MHDVAGSRAFPPLALAPVDEPDDLPDLPERLAAGAEMTSIDTITCEADLTLTAPVTTCTGSDTDSVLFAYLVRSGEDGTDLAVLLAAAQLSDELTTEVTDPDVSVHYAAEDRLFTADPARLDPETLRLRAEMAVADMGLTQSVQGCRTEDGAAVTCTVAGEGGEDSSAQITLYPAVSTSEDQITVGLLRHA